MGDGPLRGRALVPSMGDTVLRFPGLGVVTASAVSLIGEELCRGSVQSLVSINCLWLSIFVSASFLGVGLVPFLVVLTLRARWHVIRLLPSFEELREGRRYYRSLTL